MGIQWLDIINSRHFLLNVSSSHFILNEGFIGFFFPLDLNPCDWLTGAISFLQMIFVCHSIHPDEPLYFNSYNVVNIWGEINHQPQSTNAWNSAHIHIFWSLWKTSDFVVVKSPVLTTSHGLPQWPESTRRELHLTDRDVNFQWRGKRLKNAKWRRLQEHLLKLASLLSLYIMWYPLYCSPISLIVCSVSFSK